MPLLEAALDIDLRDYAAWGEAERIAMNVAAIYGELAEKFRGLSAVKLFGLMQKYVKKRGL